MRVHIRSRAILFLSVGVLLTLRPPATSANLTLNSGNTSDGSLSVESKSAGEFIVTSPAALSHAALTGLITNAFGPSGPGAADQASTSDCPASNTQLSFDTCFSVPSLNPAGQYFFIPQISVWDGELYWQFVPRPVLAAGTGLKQLD